MYTGERNSAIFYSYLMVTHDSFVNKFSLYWELVVKRNYVGCSYVVEFENI